MTKIIGLLNLKHLFIYEENGANFENAVNASYKLSEDGADGILIYGSTFKNRLRLFQYLKDRLDIFVSPFIKTKNQLGLVTPHTPIFSEEKQSYAVRTIVPKKLYFLNNTDYKENKKKAILLPDETILKLFHTSVDFLPEFSALISHKICEKQYGYIILERVLSAQKGAEFCKKVNRYLF